MKPHTFTVTLARGSNKKDLTVEQEITMAQAIQEQLQDIADCDGIEQGVEVVMDSKIGMEVKVVSSK